MADVKKVLVVDDHFEMLEFLQTMLELSAYDYEVFAVPSAEEGMLELGRTAFDLLITDIRLPGMSGFDFVRRAKSRSRNENLPVIMITAYSSDQGREEAKELGVHHYFTKPFADTDEVLTAVNEILYGPPPSTKVIHPAADVPHLNIVLPVRVEKRLRTLTTDTGAALILLATKQGQMLLQTGSIRKLNTQQMATIISSNLINSKQLTQQLGGDVVTTIQYHAGDRLEMYTANIGPDYFMSIIFDVQVRRGRFGTIWVFTQRAIKKFQPKIPALPIKEQVKTAVNKKQPKPKSVKHPSPAKQAIPAPKPTPPIEPPKPKEHRRRPIYPNSASSGNVEFAAPSRSKSIEPPKKKGPKPSAPPPSDFFVDGDQAAVNNNDNEAEAFDIGDLKALLGTPSTNTTLSNDSGETTTLGADDLKALLGTPSTNNIPSSDSGKTMTMSADDLKALLGVPSADTAANNDSNEMMTMGADDLKALLRTPSTDTASSNDNSNEATSIDADDLKALLGNTSANDDAIDLADLLIGDAPDDDTIDFESKVISDMKTPPPEKPKPMSFAEAQKMGLVGGSILPKANKPAKPKLTKPKLSPQYSTDDIDLDDFWNTAVSTTEKQNSGILSLEEARRQGIIP